MTSSTFQSTKQLRVTLTLGAPGAAFNQTGNNTLVVTNLRMSATVHAVARFATELDLRIYGMRQADMNSLTVLFFGASPSIQLNNTVLLEANGGDGWNRVFFGTIIQGSPDYRSMPNVPFHIQGMIGYFNGNAVTPPLSYPNGTSVAQAVQTVAKTLQMQFQNNGVTASLAPGSYFPGSALDQLRAITHAANVDYYFNGNTIDLCNKGQPVSNPAPIALSPQTGLIGYPRIEVGGIGIEAYYSPLFTGGSLIQVSNTAVPAANGTWMPYALTHELESWTPGGSWFSSIHCLWQQS